MTRRNEDRDVREGRRGCEEDVMLLEPELEGKLKVDEPDLRDVSIPVVVES